MAVLSQGCHCLGLPRTCSITCSSQSFNRRPFRCQIHKQSVCFNKPTSEHGNSKVFPGNNFYLTNYSMTFDMTLHAMTEGCIILAPTKLLCLASTRPGLVHVDVHYVSSASKQTWKCGPACVKGLNNALKEGLVNSCLLLSPQQRHYTQEHVQGECILHQKIAVLTENSSNKEFTALQLILQQACHVLQASHMLFSTRVMACCCRGEHH